MPARQFSADDPARTMASHPADPRTRPYYLDFAPDLYRGPDPSRTSGGHHDAYRDADGSRQARPSAYRDAPAADRYREDRYRDDGYRDDGYRDDRYSGDGDRSRDGRPGDRHVGNREASAERSATNRVDRAGRAGRTGGPRLTSRTAAARPSSKGPQATGRRVPPLVRGTLAVGLLLAVAASVVRAGVSTGGGRDGGATLVRGQETTSSLQMGAASATGVGRRASVAGAALAPSCRVNYAVTARAAGRFTAVLTLVNSGSAPIEGWTLRWSYPPGTKLSDGWNAAVSSRPSGGAQARNVAGDRVLARGGSTTIGFVGTFRATPARGRTAGSDPTQPAPSGFSLNGVTCR